MMPRMRFARGMRRGGSSPRTTSAIMAFLRHIRLMTSNATSVSRTMMKRRSAMSPSVTVDPVSACSPLGTRGLFAHLIDNARDTPIGCRMDLRPYRRTSASAVDVRDTGQDFKPESASHIVGRFHRASPDRGGWNRPRVTDRAQNRGTSRPRVDGLTLHRRPPRRSRAGEAAAVRVIDNCLGSFCPNSLTVSCHSGNGAAGPRASPCSRVYLKNGVPDDLPIFAAPPLPECRRHAACVVAPRIRRWRRVPRVTGKDCHRARSPSRLIRER